MTHTPGTHLYKYILKQKIGGGYFGEVWLANDATLSTDVAVKLLDEKSAPAAIILKEAQVGNKLNHQNVVKIHYADVVDVDGSRVVVIAMDYHANGSIVGQVNSGNFIIAPRAVSLTIDILRGLEYLHDQSLFHNDIKPSNILLGSRGNALITDFGISCVSSGLAPTAAPSAYLLHRAPETAATNSISVTTDIYQVGLTLYRFLNGIDSIKDLVAKVGIDEFEKLKTQGKVPPPDGYMPFIIPALKRIIARATDPDPVLRFQTALEMRRALEKISMRGYWDVKATGEFFGTLANNIYTFSISQSKAGYEFSAFKENSVTKRKVRVSKFSVRGLTERAYLDAQKKFMLAVVNGEF